MRNLIPEPLRVVCKSCNAEGQTYDFRHPDLAVRCGCCPVEHDHAGLGCRPVTIYAIARLSLFDVSELLEMAAGKQSGDLEIPQAQEVASLWQCLTAQTARECWLPS